MSAVPLTEEDLHELYLWVDDIPISRPKRNIARDFSDGLCVAEVVKHFFPKLVEMHNYTSANATSQKLINWDTLNKRVFRKMNFEVPPEEVRDITSAVPGAIERFLRALRTKIDQIILIQKEQQSHGGSGGEHDDELQHRDHPPAQPRGQSHGGVPPRPSSGMAGARPVSGGSSSRARPVMEPSQAQVDALLDEKDRTILELRKSVTLLQDKLARMEELVKVKDEKIARYKQQLGQR